MKDIQHRNGPFFAVAPPSNSISAIFDSDAERGAVVYVASGGHVNLAQANADPQARAVGLASAAVQAGEPGEYLTSGVLTNNSWSLTPGEVYYLDPAVPGGITATFPTTNGHYIIVIGMAATPTSLTLAIHWALALGT